MVYQQMGKDRETIDIYERVIGIDPGRAVALNNLAWLLVTTPDEKLRDPDRAVYFARRAVALDRSPGFLDTLAEACFAKGLLQEAIKTIEEAIATATDNRSYYKKQLKKFLGEPLGSGS
jgi:tetratricopeptide (TPR) repeat protein